MTKISIAPSAPLISRMSASVAVLAISLAAAGAAHATSTVPAAISAEASVGTTIAPVKGSVQAIPAAHATKPAVGGPFEVATAEATTASTDLRSDMQMRSLFMTWKKLDSVDQGGVIAIPSVQPVAHLAFTSNFGVRSDPFRGTAAMHAGVDIPGPVGTPVYATADGVVDRAERAGGYGNLIEINHGKGIQTRYGHLSKILVAPYAHVHRGDLIALMGSTGRSTGPHLHYEVRIDGSAVNPVPFLQTADYLLAAKDKSLYTIPVSVGAESAD